MSPGEFREFWALEGKCITADVEFLPSKDDPSKIEFSEVEVLNELAEDVCICGTYYCRTGGMSFNFFVRGKSAICRYDMDTTVHRGAGRHHWHYIKNTDCARRNLPHAVRRDDLKNLTPMQVWSRICIEGKIKHTGQFFEPQVKCK